MLKYDGYSVVMQEVPDEITLAFNITGCPYHCVGCHSEFLQGDSGIPLLNDLIDIVGRYRAYISCVCFMGGDHEMKELIQAVWELRSHYPELLLCIYTGNDNPDDILFDLFDYVKVGHYDKDLGGLNSPKTNQRMYKHGNDITADFINKTHRPV